MSALFHRKASHHRALAGRAMLLMAMLSFLLGSGAVVAQNGATAVVNVVVAFAPPYTPTFGATVVPSAAFESVLANGSDMVLVTNGEFDRPAQIRLEALEGLNADTDGLVSVDAGTSSNPMYWLDLFTLGDTPYGAFTISRPGETGTTITMFMGNVASFADGLAVAQQSVIVDGTPIFDGVEPGGLQDLLEVALPELGSGPGGGAAAPTATATDTNDFAGQPGMVGEGSYISPQHEFHLTWTDEWIFDDQYDAPVASDVNSNFDEVHLAVASPQWVWFGFYAGEIPPGNSFRDLMNLSSSPERLAVEIDSSAELVVSRIGVNADGDDVGALIIRATIQGYDFVVYEEYRANADGSAVAILQLSMLVDDAVPGLDSSGSLEFDGGPIITLFTPDEILSAANASGTLQGQLPDVGGE